MLHGRADCSAVFLRPTGIKADSSLAYVCTEARLPSALLAIESGRQLCSLQRPQAMCWQKQQPLQRCHAGWQACSASQAGPR